MISMSHSTKCSCLWKGALSVILNALIFFYVLSIISQKSIKIPCSARISVTKNLAKCWKIAAKKSKKILCCSSIGVLLTLLKLGEILDVSSFEEKYSKLKILSESLIISAYPEAFLVLSKNIHAYAEDIHQCKMKSFTQGNGVFWIYSIRIKISSPKVW